MQQNRATLESNPGSCANILFATVSGAICGYGIFLIATMFIHFCLKHLLYRPGKQLFQF
jgi:hypothetical protein